MLVAFTMVILKVLIILQRGNPAHDSETIEKFCMFSKYAYGIKIHSIGINY